MLCVMATLQYKVCLEHLKCMIQNACVVCPAHSVRCALHSIDKCEIHTTYLVCFTHSKKCAYRDIAGTCVVHTSFFTVYVIHCILGTKLGIYNNITIINFHEDPSIIRPFDTIKICTAYYVHSFSWIVKQRQL